MKRKWNLNSSFSHTFNLPAEKNKYLTQEISWILIYGKPSMFSFFIPLHLSLIVFSTCYHTSISQVFTKCYCAFFFDLSRLYICCCMFSVNHFVYTVQLCRTILSVPSELQSSKFVLVLSVFTVQKSIGSSFTSFLHHLKGPKHENFCSQFLAPSKPICVTTDQLEENLYFVTFDSRLWCIIFLATIELRTCFFSACSTCS